MGIKVRKGGVWVEVSSGGGGSSDPVGTIVAWADSTPPTGWLECNGQSTSGYTELAAVVGANVPDLRGEFVRGWDNSKGTDTGRTLGSTQADEFKSHNHPYNSYTGGGGPLGGHDGDAYNGKPTTDSVGGTETRPRNIALMYIIKHTASSGGGGGGSLVKLGTVATTSGTEAAFTSIPSTAKKITVAIHNFGFSGSSDEFIMQVGDSGGYATTGYQSSYDATDATNTSRTNAYGLTPGTDSGLEYNITVELVNVTGNSWTISHTGGSNTTPYGSVIYGGGSISLSNALDKLKIKTANGRTLDNGHITVYYETEGSSGSGTGTTKVALLSDKKSSGTDGGTFTAGSWVDRTLNTEVDPQNFVTLDSGNVYWSLEAGTYRITWSTPAYNTNSHASALLYSTSNTFSSPTDVEGSSEFDSAGIEPNSQTRSFGDTIVTVSQKTYFKIQHRCTFSQSTNGLGNATGLQAEVYTQVSITDLG